jgi:hypothetical protein
MSDNFMEAFDENKLNSILEQISEPNETPRCAVYIWLKAGVPKYGETYTEFLLDDLAKNGILRRIENPRGRWSEYTWMN